VKIYTCAMRIVPIPGERKKSRSFRADESRHKISVDHNLNIFCLWNAVVIYI